MSMLSLLDLPREIREHIIQYVILHKDEEPLSLDASPSRADLVDGFEYFSRTKQHGIKWPSLQPQWRICTDPAALLQTNKLLREETLYIIGQQDRSTHPRLDILIVNEDELWPTWTYIPACQGNRPRNLSVTVRMCGIAAEGCSGFQEDSGLVTLWRFSSILERILRCGWQTPQSGDVDDFIQLESLELNFVTPDTKAGPIMADSIAPHWAQHERQRIPNAQIHPYALAMSLANWISVMLQYRAGNLPFMHDPHDLLNLVDRINTMRFKVDGVLRHTEIIHMPPANTTT